VCRTSVDTAVALEVRRNALRTAALLILIACKREEGPAIEVPPEVEVVRPPSDLIKRVRPAMGTYVELTFEGMPEEEVNRAAELAFAEFDRIERLTSEWKPESQLSAVNAAAGEKAVAVDRELYDLVARAIEFSEKTQGSFDPTFAAMWGLWTFGDDGIHTPPDPKEVERRRALIDRRKVKLSDGTIFLEAKGMKLGLGGIAKGYAVDRAAALMRARGAKRFLIKAGGELYAAGPWKVGLRDPRSSDHFASIELDGESFGTSGDYERFFMADGVRYHHIIDPKTGYPATLSRSATVLAKDALTSDALTKALFILGEEKGMKLMESFGVEAVLVTADNRVLTTPGLKQRLIILRQPTP
jgi:FAD:protein FMN transferase